MAPRRGFGSALLVLAMANKIPEKKHGSELPLTILDSLLNDSGSQKINENQIFIILDALANADDVEVIARFPAVLAVCARKGLSLNSQALFSRYWETSPKRQNLEKLILVSAGIFRSHKLKPPGNLEKIVTSLQSKYDSLLAKREFQLSNGMFISIQELERSLIGYLSGQLPPQKKQELKRPSRSNILDIYLDRLFSPKQKELVFKKRDGIAFTKTEREYYSRIVRKKLEAIASEEVGKMARTLIIKSGKKQF